MVRACTRQRVQELQKGDQGLAVGLLCGSGLREGRKRPTCLAAREAC